MYYLLELYLPSSVLVLFYITSQHWADVGIVLALYKGRNQSTQNSNSCLKVTELVNIARFCLPTEFTDFFFFNL